MDPINSMTAEPMLRLMVAMAGHYPLEGIPFDEGWRVFKNFLAIPSIYEHDVAAFQIVIDRDPELEPAAAAIFGREFRWPPSGEGDSGIRRALISFDLAAEGGDVPEAVELWSSDYPSLDAFVAAVETTPAFMALHDGPWTYGLVCEEYEADPPSR